MWKKNHDLEIQFAALQGNLKKLTLMHDCKDVWNKCTMPHNLSEKLEEHNVALEQNLSMWLKNLERKLHQRNELNFCFDNKQKGTLTLFELCINLSIQYYYNWLILFNIEKINPNMIHLIFKQSFPIHRMNIENSLLFTVNFLFFS